MYREFLPFVKESHFRRSRTKGAEQKVGQARPASRLRSPSAIAYLMVAVSIIVTAITALAWEGRGTTYQTASAPTSGILVAVRFAEQATAADITAFLEAYQGSIIAEPRGMGFYRIRMSDSKLSPEELSKFVARMARDKIVNFVAVQQ
jgi:hypothetical protein